MTMRPPASDLPIVLDDVSVTVRSLIILDRLSLTITAGPPTVLIGPNGSGKTTLLKVIMGLLSPNDGRVIYDGRNKSQPDRAAIVFQRPVMLRRSAGANIRYALAREQRTDRRVGELLAQVGLSGLEHRPARQLSGGEQQRLALARALACEPELLLLDEPAASLDPAATKAIEDIVRTVSARGTKVIMSTHDLGQAKRLAGDIILLHRGRLVEYGPAADFFAAPRTAAAKAFITGELLV
jgi:tungstate transport system ATP-binding protein